MTLSLHQGSTRVLPRSLDSSCAQATQNPSTRTGEPKSKNHEKQQGPLRNSVATRIQHLVNVGTVAAVENNRLRHQLGSLLLMARGTLASLGVAQQAPIVPDRWDDSFSPLAFGTRGYMAGRLRKETHCRGATIVKWYPRASSRVNEDALGSL